MQQINALNVNFQEICAKLTKIHVYDKFIAYSSRTDSEIYEESDKSSFENFFANLSGSLRGYVFLILRPAKEGHIDMKLTDYDVSSQITSLTNASRAVLFSSGTIFPVTIVIIYD